MYNVHCSLYMWKHEFCYSQIALISVFCPGQSYVLGLDGLNVIYYGKEYIGHVTNINPGGGGRYIVHMSTVEIVQGQG